MPVGDDSVAVLFGVKLLCRAELGVRMGLDRGLVERPFMVHLTHLRLNAPLTVRVRRESPLVEPLKMSLVREGILRMP